MGGGGKGGALCLGFPGFGRVAPVGLLCMEGCLTQGLVALAGLRTLGFGKGRPAGAYPAARELPRSSTIGA